MPEPMTLAAADVGGLEERTRRNQRSLALHGSVVLLIGLLAGIGFSYAASTASVTSDLYKNWKFAHLEGLLNGVVVLGVAGVWAHVDLPPRRRSVDIGRWLLVLGAYANAIGPWIPALLIGHRVIQPTGLLESVLVYGFYVPGVLPLFSFLLFVWAQVRSRSGVVTPE